MIPLICKRQICFSSSFSKFICIKDYNSLFLYKYCDIIWKLGKTRKIGNDARDKKGRERMKRNGRERREGDAVWIQNHQRQTDGRADLVGEISTLKTLRRVRSFLEEMPLMQSRKAWHFPRVADPDPRYFVIRIRPQILIRIWIWKLDPAFNQTHGQHRSKSTDIYRNRQTDSQTNKDTGREIGRKCAV